MGQTIQLPPIIFGAMAHHGAGGDDARIALVRDAVQLGFRAFDTAPLYGFGASERQLGQALAGVDALVLGKVGLRWDGDHGEVLFATPTHTVRKDSRPRSILAEIDQSLERLRRDRIDVLQLHHPDERVPIAETVDALLEAHAVGKVTAIGVSNFSPVETRAVAKALGDVPLFSAQDGYNLLERRAEHLSLSVCSELECAFLAFSPLAQGVLAGKLLGDARLSEGDWRAGDPKFAPQNRAAICNAMRTSMAPAAKRHGATLAQVALAWLLARPGVTAVIAGARTEEHARANLGASQIALDHSEIAAMEQAFSSLDLGDGLGKRERVERLARRGFGKIRRLFTKD